MDEFKLKDLPQLPNHMTNIDLSKIQQHIRQPQINMPKVPHKEEPKPKTGFEAWYDKNSGKIAFIFGILSTILGSIAIYEAYVIFKLSK